MYELYTKRKKIVKLVFLDPDSEYGFGSTQLKMID